MEKRTTSRYSLWIGIILVFVIIGATRCLAAQTAGRGPVVTGDSLIVTWEKPQDRPAYLVWYQTHSLSSLKSVSDHDTYVRMNRRGFNSVPSRLIIIPDSSHRRPKLLEVKKDQKRLSFQTRPIPENEIWIWGIIPTDPCPSARPYSTLYVSIRMLDRPSEHYPLKGSFLERIDLTKGNRPLYIDPTSPGLEDVNSPVFHPANQSIRQKCRQYRMGSCPFVYEIPCSMGGRVYRVHFSLPSSSSWSCPD